jgi:hypothetical protein
VATTMRAWQNSHMRGANRPRSISAQRQVEDSAIEWIGTTGRNWRMKSSGLHKKIFRARPDPLDTRADARNLNLSFVAIVATLHVALRAARSCFTLLAPGQQREALSPGRLMGSPPGVIPLGTTRDGLRSLEATLPSGFYCGRAKRRQSEARHRQTPGPRCVRALSASPHDEISPKRHRERLDAPAYNARASTASLGR